MIPQEPQFDSPAPHTTPPGETPPDAPPPVPGDLPFVPQNAAVDALTAQFGQQLPAPPILPGIRMPPPSGRRYGFLCGYCSSRLEATDTMAGQSGTCPTCGNAIVIPILDYRGRLIDPTSGQIIKQDPHPVHAYAAAGHRAPRIINAADGTPHIQCPRCPRLNPISANNCLGCGLPFTMDGTVGDTVSGTNTWAVASLILGIVGIVGGACFIVPPILAIIFGGIAMRGGSNASGQRPGQGLAIAGIILGIIGLLIMGAFVALNMH